MDFFYIAGVTPPDKPIKLEIDLLGDTNYDYYMTALPSRIIVCFKYKEENGTYTKITRFNIVVANENTNVTTGDYAQVKLFKKTYTKPEIPPVDREDWNYYIISTYNKERPLPTNACDKKLYQNDSLDSLTNYYCNKEIDVFTLNKLDTLDATKSIHNNIYYSCTLNDSLETQLLTNGINNFTISMTSGITSDTLCNQSDVITDTINLSKPSPTASPDEVDILAITPYRHRRYYIGGLSDKPIKLDVVPASTHLAYMIAKSTNEYILFSKTAPRYANDSLADNKPSEYAIIDALHIKKNNGTFEYKYDVRHIEDNSNNNPNNIFTEEVYSSWLKPISHTYTTNYADIFDDLNNKCQRSMLINYVDDVLITLTGDSLDDTISRPTRQDTIISGESESTIRAIERNIYASQWQGIYTDTTGGNESTNYKSKPVDEIYLYQLININGNEYRFIDVLTGADTLLAQSTLESFTYESTESNLYELEDNCHLPLLTDSSVKRLKYKIFKLHKETNLDTLTGEKLRTHKTIRILAMHPLNKVTSTNRVNTNSQGYYKMILKRNNSSS